MRKFIILTTLLMISFNIFAQEVTTLTFTAKQQNGTYQKIDSIMVTNLDREWSEVLYYPDTLLLINTVGLMDYHSQNGKVKLFQNIPNPFHGITNFNLTLSNKEKVELLIFDINGKKVAEYHNTLPSGEHQFRAILNTPQTYLLSAVTKNGNTSIKMINISNHGEQCRIEHVRSMPLSSDCVKKESSNPFAKGDNMQYIGYATQKDGSKHTEITQKQDGSENITFIFPNEPKIIVITDSVSAIDTNSATLFGSYSIKYTEINEVGFAYKSATDQEYTLVQSQEISTPFSLKLSNLSVGTDYRYKAYTKTTNDFITYGEEKTFTTDSIFLDVQTLSINNITGHSAQVTSKLATNLDSKYLLLGVRIYNEDETFDTLYLSRDLNNGIFTTDITNLTKGTHYYVQAYTKHNSTEVHGETMEFTTLSFFECGDKLEDIEKNSYSTVQIGSQCWMSQDMRSKVYADGTPISSGYYLYTEDSTMGPLAYYDFMAATRLSTANKDITKGVQGICPDGWHIPSYSDYNLLCKSVDPAFNGPTSSNSGIKEYKSDGRLAIKLAYPAHWIIPNTGPIENTPSSYITNSQDFNASGFAAIARGYMKNSTVSCPGSSHYWTAIGDPSGRCDIFKITATSTGVVYQSYDKNGKESYGVRCVMDTLSSLPQVQTFPAETERYDNLGALLKGQIISTCNTEIYEMGFYFDTKANPIINGQKFTITDAVNFSYEILELAPATTYYFAAFLTTKTGTTYGDILSFTTREKGDVPVIESGHAIAFSNSAEVSATLVSTGGEAMIDLGFCYGEKSNPTIENDTIVKITFLNVGEFSTIITNLKAKSTYYIRPFATNTIGTAYGSNIQLTTVELTRPEVRTIALYDSTQTSVMAVGKILIQGGSPDIEIGFVYSDTTTEPDLSNNYVTATMQADSLFTSIISDLQQATTYHVRAYAKNSAGTAYGETMSFNTTSGFQCGDKLTDVEGNEYPTVRIGKQCWMQENLRVHKNPNGEQITSRYWEYTDTIYGLGYNTYYSWEAATRLTQANLDEYSITQGICPDGWHIPSYGDCQELCLYIDPDITYVQIPDNTTTTSQTVTSKNKLCIKLCKPHQNWSLSSGSPTEGTPAWGTIHNDSDFNASGFSALPFGYWSKDRTTNPQIGPGNQAGFVTSNNPTKDYTYARTFGIKPAQTGIMHEKTNGHGWSVRCIMDPIPTLPSVKTLTADLSIYDSLGARLNGKIISTGHSQLLESGFYFGTDTNPIVSGQKLTSGDVNTLLYDIQKLSSETTYFYAAYTTSAVGTGYGEIMSFTTRKTGSAPVIETKEATPYATYANISADLKSNGGEKISELGFCYGTSKNPSLKTDQSQTVSILQQGEFRATITNLKPMTTYYLRPYAINMIDTTYGDNIEIFTSQLTLPKVRTIHLTDTTNSAITAWGKFLNDGGDNNITFGFAYSDTLAEPTVENSSIEVQDLLKDSTFTSTITDLTAATTYYIRAYATNSMGTSYGEVMTFNTAYSCGTRITDIDGNSYNTVQIGNQCWMKDNLRTTRYSNGTTIALYSGNSSTGALRFEPDGNSSNIKAYGYLYNWNAAMAQDMMDTIQSICPKGWHLPTDSNWIELIACVGANSNNTCNNNTSHIAKALAYTDRWNSSTLTCAIGNNISNNNNTDFSAMPAGIYTEKGSINFGSLAGFISSSSKDTTEVIILSLMADSANVQLSPMDKRNGFSVRCISDETFITHTVPTVVTTPVTKITSDSVMLGGNVYLDGECTVFSKGICWSTDPHPTISDSRTTDSSGLGTFVSTLNDLEAATIYYARAYAQNYMGVSYGNEIIFMTANTNDGQTCSRAGTVSDYDNNIYETVQIGGQCWMREHLRTTHYSDGTKITLTTDSMSEAVPYCYNPRNNASKVATLGYLYNWAAVMHNEESSAEVPSKVQGICPTGWHVPSNGEWQLLTDYMSSQSQYACNKPRAMAKALASTDDSWSTSKYTCAIGNDISLNNHSGFDAKSAGGFYGGTSGGGLMVSMWSCTAENEYNAYFRSMRYYYAYVTADRHSKANGFSVRCLMD